MNDRQESTAVVEAFSRLSESLGAMVSVDGLDPVARQILDDRVARLISDRAVFMMAFHKTWPDHAVSGFEALRSASVTDTPRLYDELMHLFAFERLTLVDGAETAGHLERTAACMALLARATGESEEACAVLRLAARMHDVGLAAVPEELFAHRARVDSYEAMLVETHVRIGTVMVDALVERLGVHDGPFVVGREIVRCHHERQDGLGPLGLAAEAIPRPARLFALADVYDTLRRRGPHRNGLDHAAAVMALRAGNRDGQAQFDPVLLTAFLDCAEQVGALYGTGEAIV